MNWDVVEGNWKQLKGSAIENWGKLTNDDMDVVSGNREKLVGLLQEKYGWARDEAESEVDGWAERQKSAA